MTQVHEGQKVEVAVSLGDAYDAPMSRAREWRKAKIVKRGEPYSKTWIVQFPDGQLGVFAAENIREVSK